MHCRAWLDAAAGGCTFGKCRKGYPLSRGTQETPTAEPLGNLLPPKWEEDRSDLIEFKSSLYSPPFGNPSLNKIFSQCKSGLNRSRSLTHKLHLARSAHRTLRGEGFNCPTVHRPHKQFSFFKKKHLGILPVRDGGSAI